jgi:hypothetical protein
MLEFLRRTPRDYYELLPRIHSLLKPKTYAEIGIRNGDSLMMAKTAVAAVGIDPAPKLREPLPSSFKVFELTSDDFFARHNLMKELGGRTCDLSFIDGMHLFEFALRDFIGLEKAAGPNSTILIHDCYPHERAVADRERSTDLWAGDVWKLIVCLKKYRPDLSVWSIVVPPTGLGVVRNLDAKSTVLEERLKQICDEFIGADYSSIERDKAAALNRVEKSWSAVKSILTRSPRTPTLQAA